MSTGPGLPTAASLTTQDIRRLLAARPKRSLNDPAYVPAAVLLILYPREDGFHILLQKRTDQVEHHKGEISLPGGARDPEDDTLLATALREAWEEMGIRPEDVEVLGELDDTPTRSRFCISTFVATIPYPYTFRVNPVECAEVLEVPLAALLHPSNAREEARWLDGRLERSYAYAHQHHLIYGATARILQGFLDLLRQGP